MEYQVRSDAAKCASVVSLGIGLVAVVDFIAKWIFGGYTITSTICAAFFFTASLILYGHSHMWQNEADLVKKKIVMLDLVSKNKTHFLLMS